MIDGQFEDVADFEYLSVSGRRLGRSGVLELFEDIAFDNTVRQLDVGYNITAEEFACRRDVESFMRAIRKMLLRNKTLTALELAGNNLFQSHPHPSNEHVKSYEEELVKVLKDSQVSRLDLSDNNISGHSGRELHGLTHIMRDFLQRQGRALKCRLSKLNSQGFWAVSNCLGRFSSMTFLDLSYNCGGLDPLGRPNSEGVAALAMQMAHALQMRVLKLAANHLRDDHIALVGDALQRMPQFQDLDIAGNMCRTNGMRALKNAIVSHSIFDTPSQGIRHLDISNNPIGEGGARELGSALPRTHTMKTLKMRFCNVNDAGMEAVCAGLAENCSVILLETEGNNCRDATEEKTQAEVEATRNVFSLQEDAHSIDASVLARYAYLALARKLRYMSPAKLAALHTNASFTQPETEMQESLFLLEPPPRKALVGEVCENIKQRLELSAQLDAKMAAADVIFRNVMVWYEPFRIENNLRRALLRARVKTEKKSAHNDEDDRFPFK